METLSKLAPLVGLHFGVLNKCGKPQPSIFLNNLENAYFVVMSIFQNIIQ